MMIRPLPDTRQPMLHLTQAAHLEALNRAMLEHLAITDPRIQKQFIGFTGIQNASQMALFLKSPEGEAQLSEMAKELAVLEAIHQRNLQEHLEHQRLRKMLLAFFLLGALSKSEAKSKRLNAFILQQYQDLLKKREQLQLTTQSTALSTTHEILSAYLKGMNALIQQQHDLNLELNDIAKTQQALEKRYTAYEKTLTSLHELFSSDIDTLSEADLKEGIVTLSKTIDAQTQHISNALERGEDDKAMELLNKQNADNLKIAGLKDLLSAKMKEKILIGHHGFPVKSYHEAAYITESTKKIVRYQDEVFLVNEHEEHLLNDNHELRARAKQDFLHKQSEMTPLRELIHSNKATEMSLLSIRIEHAHNRQAQLNEVATGLWQRINEIQSAQPLLTPKPGAPKLKETPEYAKMHQQVQQTASHYVVARLETLQYQSAPDGSAFSLKDALQNLRNNPSLAELPFVREELNDIDPGQPIPPALYRQLLQRNNLTTQSPWMHIPNAPDDAKTQEEKPTASPTPFDGAKGPKPF